MAVSALTIGAVLQVQGSGAAAQVFAPTLVESAPQVVFTSAPVVQPLPVIEQVSPEAAPSSDPAPENANSLAELVAAQG
ncbi:MAG: cell wall hydrolase, partial [Novosphingobium sp.]